MKQLMIIAKALWASELPFRLAAMYLLLIGLLLLVLPWLPLPYTPNALDLEQVYLSPFEARAGKDHRHWLGTDGLGRDVLSNLLYGLQTAFWVGIPVMVLATGIGLLLGAFAGLHKNQGITLSRAGLAAGIVALPMVVWFALYLPLLLLPHTTNIAYYIVSYTLAVALGCFVWWGLGGLLKQAGYFRHKLPLPVDEVVLRLIEVLSSIPRLVLILVLAAIFPPRIGMLATLLVLTFWTGPARLARAEMLRIRELPFFEAATALGFSSTRRMLHHALPHLLAPVAVAFMFGLAGLMLLESTLTFLNIGVDSEMVSLGRMIAGIRANTAAWWLVLLPGSLLSLTVLALQTCSYYLLKGFKK